MPAKPGDKKHGVEVWIGIDFDGTLVVHESGAELSMIGPAIKPMVERVKGWLVMGWKVKIFTARVTLPEQEEFQRKMIETWCQSHIGRVLEVTAVKDFACEVIWDDRATSVQRNTGRFVRVNTLGDRT